MSTDETPTLSDGFPGGFPTDDIVEAHFARAAAEANKRIANCHEVVACPKCHAPIGERCRRARAQHTRRGVFATAEPVLKHPHRERWTQVQPDR